ncbi:autotransporter assembly complex protein TamA [Lichenicola sp.]|uniref:autotransporter assembly complex protein TamA n=1 Tax=Lichenicola sp. TaxID=2804529 RepID=UPI003AFF7B06
MAADPQPYKVSIQPTGDAALDGAIKGSSSLVSLQKTQAVGPFALAGRARADVARLRTALESFGYYDGHIDISVAGHPVTDPALPDLLAALPKGTVAPIRIAIGRGPLFHVGTVTLKLPPGVVLSGPEQAAFGLTSGQPAVASDVLAASGRLQTALEEEGHAFATVDPPVAYLRPGTRTLDIVASAKPGPRVDIGAIHLAGLKRVDPGFVRRELLVHQGQLYQPSKIEAARQDLASLGVFSSVGVSAAQAVAPDGSLPITFDFTEALRHTVALQAGYSTDLGGSAGVTWTHHNLFGEAEKLDLAALLTGLGGTSQQGLGYDVYADLLKPDFYRRNQSLDLRVEGLKQDLQAYNQTALLVRATINRKISTSWTISAGVGAEQERILQEGVSRSYTLAFVPIAANYDSTHLANPLDDPTHGFRISIDATPSYSLGSGSGDSTSNNQGGDTFFTILQSTVSTYFDLHRIGLAAPGRSVIAVRGVVGTVQGATTFELPPDQRLYAGGSGTVRGYKYQGVGPLFADGYPVGGTSVDAGTVEFRQRIGKSFGVAAFADAGQVSDSSAPFGGTLRVGAGVGGRYYTPIGPIRLDVAVPLNKPPGGDTFELYIGLGEAF